MKSFPAENKRLVLRDGRVLGFAEYGDSGGMPLVFFHGFPGSRLEGRLAAQAATRAGIRLVAPDRPGMGLSSPQRGRALTDWPTDMVALADHLAIGRFAVLGVSGGGPYALSCAALIPSRLQAAGIVGGMAPLASTGLARELNWSGRVGFALTMRSPGLTDWAFRAILGPLISRCPGLVRRVFSAGISARDRDILQRPEVREVLRDSGLEAVREGGGGAWRDFFLLASPWGFGIGEIAMPIDLWYGTEDRIVPPVMGESLAAALPRSRPRFIDGEGHFSLPIGRMPEILGALTR
jgi:pimeloyl-ACP methyl ester carboxylesterase